MSDERTQHITVRLSENFRFTATFDEVPGAAIVFDEPAPLGENSAPNAAAVLGAAVGNCLAASLTFCLRRARMDVQGMTARVTTRVARDERGRYRIRAIDVALDPQLAMGTDIGRCEGLFEDFCIVTGSVQHGIPVHLALKAADDKAA